MFASNAQGGVYFSGEAMSQEPDKVRPEPIQPRTPVPGQDPLVNPGYQPVPQDLPAITEPKQPDRPATPKPA